MLLIIVVTVILKVMGTIVQIKRANEPSDEVILQDGEMAYSRTNREFYIGDGETVMSELTPFMSLVLGDDGRVYTVRVDKEGNAHAKPVVCYAGNRILEFKAEE